MKTWKHHEKHEKSRNNMKNINKSIKIKARVLPKQLFFHNYSTKVAPANYRSYLGKLMFLEINESKQKKTETARVKSKQNTCPKTDAKIMRISQKK